MSKTIDREWFFNKLDGGGKSVRGLARHLDLDPSAVSRMFSGARRMKMEEADKIALFLGAPVSEVLKHAGVSFDLDGLPTRIVLAATIDETGTLQPLADPKPLPQEIIDRRPGSHRRAQRQGDRSPGSRRFRAAGVT